MKKNALGGRNSHQAVMFAFALGNAPIISLIRRWLIVSMVAEGALFTVWEPGDHMADRAKRSLLEACRLHCTLSGSEASDVSKRMWQKRSVRKKSFMGVSLRCNRPGLFESLPRSYLTETRNRTSSGRRWVLAAQRPGCMWLIDVIDGYYSTWHFDLAMDLPQTK
jgi:hypothetical protein